MDNGLRLSVQGIVKDFPGVRALDHVDFDLLPGEVHAILGENGAGKSTLIKILSGVYPKDAGRILLDGREVEVNSPSQATQHGIRVIHQDLNVLPGMSVTENIFLGRMPAGRVPGTVDWRRAYEQAGEVLSRLHVKVDPRAQTKTLTTAQRQIVEIAQAIAVDARILLMDEPTAALSDTDVQALFELVASMKSQGVSVIYITHRIPEVFQIADRVTVLRDGKNAGTVAVQGASRSQLVYLMVGRQLDEMYPRHRVVPGKTLLEVQGLDLPNVLHDIHFELRAGEILGLYGLLGAGCTPLVEALFGVRPASAGKLFIDGHETSIKSPRDARAAGMGFVPQDRRAEGLVNSMDVKQNISLANLSAYYRRGYLDERLEKERAVGWIERLDIHTPSYAQIVTSLSGGNQQKVVLARWLEASSRMLILDDPTKGVDVGAKTEIYSLLDQLCADGVGVIMISSELPEILAIADRILVMSAGRITGEFSHEAATQQKIMECCCL